MTYDESKQLCRKSEEAEYNCLFIDISKKRDQGRFVLILKTKTHTLNVLWK